MKNIATALVKAQKAFGPALKSSTNPHFKSRYADLAACVEAVIEGLNTAGIALVQRTSLDDNGVTVETVFVHESGEMMECGKLHVPASKQDPQGYGSALTYARRYSLMAACGIAPEDEDGNAASKPAPKAKPEPKSEPPVKMEGKPGPWQLTVSTTPGNNPSDWVELVCEAASMQIGYAKSAADVTSIFTVNREIFNQLKAQSQGAYDVLLTTFKTAKAKFK
jgi:hypothetical protein